MEDIEVGHSDQENWNLLQRAKPSDWWFHVNAGTGAYVVVHHPKPHADLVRTACRLAKQNSRSKSLHRVRIVYCPVHNLRKGERTGEVCLRALSQCRYKLV